MNNSIKHGKARNILVDLSSTDAGGTLTISDDGCGIAADPPTDPGMGLHIMNYRAKMIGGSLDVRKRAGAGTTVTCLFVCDQAPREQSASSAAT